MSTVLPYNLVEARAPLQPILLSSPHSGTQFPQEIIADYRPQYIEHPEDTDWLVNQLYDFAPEMGITLIHASFSRYVIDLNRDPENKSLYSDNRQETSLTPTKTFAGDEIYLKNPPDVLEIKRRLSQYYWPYYEKIESVLKDLKQSFEHVLFFDAHSIKHLVKSIRPEPFPDLILGNQNRQTAHNNLSSRAFRELMSPPCDLKISENDPFKGGHLTRYFGKPQNNLHSLQLEMCQNVYMDEERCQYLPDKAEKIRVRLKNMFTGLIEELDRLNSK